MLFAGRGRKGVRLGKEGSGKETADEGVVDVALKVWVGMTPVRRPGGERKHDKYEQGGRGSGKSGVRLKRWGGARSCVARLEGLWGEGAAGQRGDGIRRRGGLAGWGLG